MGNAFDAFEGVWTHEWPEIQSFLFSSRMYTKATKKWGAGGGATWHFGKFRIEPTHSKAVYY